MTIEKLYKWAVKHGVERKPFYPFGQDEERYWKSFHLSDVHFDKEKVYLERSSWNCSDEDPYEDIYTDRVRRVDTYDSHKGEPSWPEDCMIVADRRSE